MTELLTLTRRHLARTLRQLADRLDPQELHTIVIQRGDTTTTYIDCIALPPSWP